MRNQLKKMMAMAAALGAGVAGAQAAWQNEDSTYSYTYRGCKDTQAGAECYVTFSYIGGQDVQNSRICTDSVIAVLATGDNAPADLKKFGTKEWMTTCDNIDIYKGVPLQVTFQFKGRSIKSFAKVNVLGKMFSISAPAPAPVAAPAPAQQVNLSGNWKGDLTNCRAVSNGYTCSISIHK